MEMQVVDGVCAPTGIMSQDYENVGFGLPGLKAVRIVPDFSNLKVAAPSAFNCVVSLSHPNRRKRGQDGAPSDCQGSGYLAASWRST